MNYGKFFKKWEYQTTLLPSCETCMQVKKQQLELDMEEQTGSKLGKEYITCLFNLYAENTMRNARLSEAQAGIKIVGAISITSDMQMTPLLWQKAKGN